MRMYFVVPMVLGGALKKYFVPTTDDSKKIDFRIGSFCVGILESRSIYPYAQDLLLYFSCYAGPMGYRFLVLGVSRPVRYLKIWNRV
jgi:hypothetical protein